MNPQLQALLDKIESASSSGVNGGFVEELKALAAEVKESASSKKTKKAEEEKP